MIKIIMIMAIFLSMNVSANENFKQECENGKMQSCIELGMLYHNGNGVEKNVKESQKLFKKACKDRVARGCYYLGYTYLRGAKDIEKNDKKAMLSFGRGCNIGSERSCVQYHILKDKGI